MDGGKCKSNFRVSAEQRRVPLQKGIPKPLCVTQAGLLGAVGFRGATHLDGRSF